MQSLAQRLALTAMLAMPAMAFAQTSMLTVQTRNSPAQEFPEVKADWEQAKKLERSASFGRFPDHYLFNVWQNYQQQMKTNPRFPTQEEREAEFNIEGSQKAAKMAEDAYNLSLKALISFVDQFEAARGYPPSIEAIHKFFGEDVEQRLKATALQVLQHGRAMIFRIINDAQTYKSFDPSRVPGSLEYFSWADKAGIGFDENGILQIFKGDEFIGRYVILTFDRYPSIRAAFVPYTQVESPVLQPSVP